MKKQSEYWRKKQAETVKNAPKVKEWESSSGHSYDTKFQAQAESFVNFVRGGIQTGFPIVVPRWFPIASIAVFPFILIRKDQICIPKINHEKIHIRQMWDLFVVGAYIWYPLELWLRFFGGIIFRFDAPRQALKNAYRLHSFECEARIHQDDPDYIFKRKKFAFLKYI